MSVTTNSKNYLKVSFEQRAKIGAISGLVGGFSIFFIIFIIDFQLGNTPGIFYKLVGFPIGLKGLNATLFGMMSHIGTAVIIGTIFCTCSGLHKRLELSSMKKGAFAGAITSILIYFAFFIPITMFVISPLIEDDIQNNFSLDANISTFESIILIENMNLIIFGAFEIHLLFGVIMGFFAAISIEQKSNATKRKKLIAITIGIILCTVGIGIFYSIPITIPQNELTLELSKIEPGMTFTKFIDMNQQSRKAFVDQLPYSSRILLLSEIKKSENIVNEDMSEITHDLNSPNDLKFLQSAQISGIKGNDAVGVARIISNGHETYLRLEDFSMTNGFDQVIYLTKYGDIPQGMYVGELKANKGNQNYLLEGIPSYEYNQMIIYSKSFDVYYASANLAKMGSN